MGKTYTFRVTGRPAPGGSKSGFVHKASGRVIMAPASKFTKPWMARVKAGGKAHYAGPVHEGPVRMQFTFIMERPKSHYRTGKYSHELRKDAPAHHTKAPDTTKLIRSTEDALKGICYVDDSQVVTQVAIKRYTQLDYSSTPQAPGVEITIEEIG